MAIPGWYDDPAGAPGRFRYWDGMRWSSATSASPFGPPPQDPTPKRRTNSRGWLFALVVLLVVTALAVAVVLIVTGRIGRTAQEDTNSATPTVSAWDEQPPSPQPASSSPWVACPVAAQNKLTPQVAGWLTAANFAAPRIDGWNEARLPDLPWAYDVHRQSVRVMTGLNGWTWNNSQAVGLLPNPPTHPVITPDGTDVGTAATRTLQCWTTSSNFTGMTGVTVTRDEPVTIHYHAGWHITAEVAIDFNNLPDVKGAVLQIIVVDLMQPSGELGLYVANCTLGDAACQALVANSIAGLNVT